MGRPRGIRRFFQLRWRRGWAEDTVDLEMQHHIEMRIDELIQEGNSPDQARMEAERRFGDMERYRRQCVAMQKREERTRRWVEFGGSVMWDLRYALRGLRRSPGFAVSVILTLALGIGANTAIFSVVDAVLIRPIPFPEPDQLHAISASYEAEGYEFAFFPWDGARAWMERSDLFMGIGAHARANADRTDGWEPTAQIVQALTPSAMDVLGVAPLMGRSILPEDAEPGAPSVVLLTDRFWRSGMGADPGVMGRTIVLNETRHTIIGVMPPSFRFPFGSTDLYIALRSDGTALGRAARQVQLVVRVPAELLGDPIEERMAAAAAGFQDHGPTRGVWTPGLSPLNEPQVRRRMRKALWVVFGAVGVMLLIAVVNGVNLMLARGTVRGREIGVRLALGASRRRVVRQLLVESLVLALLSGVAAVVMASAGVRALLTVAPRDITFFSVNAVGVDGRVLWFTFALSLLTGLAFGLLPALRSVRAVEATSSGSLGVHGSDKRGRLRNGLVMTQVALSLTLLFGAGLLGKSFHRLTSVDPGFEVEGLLTMSMSLNRRYRTPEEREGMTLRILERLRAIPGVVAVSRSVGIPPDGGITFGNRLETEDHPETAVEHDFTLPLLSADSDFLATIGTRLISGRAVTTTDAPGERPVVIDTDLAEELWSGGEAVGRRFRLSPDQPWYRVTGVMEDLKVGGLDDRWGEFAMITPLAPDGIRGFVTYAIRSIIPPAALFPQIRYAVRAVDSKQPIQQLQPAAVSIWQSVARPRFFMILMAVFAAVALGLAAVGVYGVLSFSMSQRSREIGIRVALGADAARVRRLVLRNGLGLAVAGTLIGVAISMWAAFVMQDLLFQTAPRDVLTFVAVAAAMLTVSALACYLPARRATRVDPIQVLKAE